MASNSVEDERRALVSDLEVKYTTKFNNKMRRRLTEASDYDFHSHALGMEIFACMKKLDLDSAYLAYSEYKSRGIFPVSSVFCNLLCLAAGLGETGCGSAQRDHPPPQDLDKALVIYADMKGKGLELNEAAYTSVIRALCTHNKVQESVEMYYEMIDKLKIEPRIRTISMLLHVLATNLDLAHCEDIFSHIQRFNLAPTEKEYASMLHIYHELKLDGKFVDCLSTMSEDILRISLASTLDTIQQFFTRHNYTITHSAVNNSNGDISVLDSQQESVRLQTIDLAEESRSLLLSQLQTLAIHRDTPGQHPNQPTNNASSTEVTPGANTSIVADVHKRYKPNNKIREQREQSAASSDYQRPHTVMINEKLSAEYGASHHAVSNIDQINGTNSLINGKGAVSNQEVRSEIWQDFTAWLEQTRVHYPFNLILDGANIGYYKQNYANAPLYISYEQIHYLYQIIKLLNEDLPEDKKMVPLIILHSRHLSSSLLPSAHVYTDLISTWPIFFTPKHFNDDWFWLYAAIKYRCKVVTNDDMRDHHFQFLSPKYFVRWRENSRIMYEIFSYRHNAAKITGPLHQNMSICSAKRTADGNRTTFHINSDERKVKVNLMNPLPYSYRIQHITSHKLDGWFIPPLMSETEVSADGEDRQTTHDESKSTDAVVLTDSSLLLPDEDEDKQEQLDPEAKLWVCIVKINNGDTDDIVSGQKRKLDD